MRDLVTALRRRSAILVIVIVAFPAGALGFSLTAEKQYTATSKLLFRDPGFDQKLFGGQVLAPSIDPAREAATNLGLVSLDTVVARTIEAIKSRPLTAAEIRSKVTIAAQGQSNVVSVDATDPSPTFAAELANTIASQYIVFRRDADRTKIDQAVSLVQRQLASLPSDQRGAREGRSLSQQVDQLRVLAALQTGNAERVQPAEVPTSPSAPSPTRNVILALLGGAVIGIGLALLLDRLDRRVHDREGAESLLGRPVLGEIPESADIAADRGGALQLTGQDAEAFRTLRANLRYYDIDREVRSLLITSSAPGDGKSTVARFLAATAAAADVRVVLIEADLRRPTLNDRYPLLRLEGLSDVLTDQASLDATIQRLPVAVAGALGGKTLDVICAGSPPPNPTDLLESHRMRAVLAELQTLYELVVIDSAPITVVPDSIPVLSLVSGVLVVLRDAKSTTVGLRRMRGQFDHLGVTPLGIVMNRTAPAADNAYYGYYLYEAHSINGSNGNGNGNGNGHGRDAPPSSRRWGRSRQKALD